MYADEPDRYFYPDQYNNPANWLAHYNGTGLEIWQQTMGCVTHFVAGLGTGGTFIGTGRRLRELNPDVRLVAVQPDSARHGLAGLKHMATSIVPGIYDPQLADEITVVETEAAHAMVRQLAREEGLLVGISAGAALVAALRLARELTEGVVVTLFPDGGGKYLSESFWENERYTDAGRVSVSSRAGGRIVRAVPPLADRTAHTCAGAPCRPVTPDA
jgi:cysteine synthase B